ncbi:MAG: IMP cyclohydrolase [Lachnospiraceae bacterium]|jgi:hypothetical protein|nr:IMP cyclohydrolase [Lachnospiraceae bacterium]
MLHIEEELKQNTYPGRGIILGKSADEKCAVIAYFIMGRSVNSRNRFFIGTQEGGVRTSAVDPSKLTDPSLVIYHPVRVFGDHTIVTNGDQTEDIYEGLQKGISFSESLTKRTFEPDPPHYTPRISGLLTIQEEQMSYQLSILKSADGNPMCANRFNFSYETPLAGIGHFIHTYQGDGNPLPSFNGEPKTIAIDSNCDTFAKTIWASLDPQNKVSLFVRYITLSNGRTYSRFFNQYFPEE